jgi:hypothetical protein
MPGDVTEVVECLLSKHKDLCSNPILHQERASGRGGGGERERERERERE